MLVALGWGTIRGRACAVRPCATQVALCEDWPGFGGPGGDREATSIFAGAGGDSNGARPGMKVGDVGAVGQKRAREVIDDDDEEDGSEAGGKAGEAGGPSVQGVDDEGLCFIVAAVHMQHTDV